MPTTLPHAFFSLVIALQTQGSEPAPKPSTPTREQIQTAGAILGLEFTDSEADLMLHGVAENRSGFERLQKIHLDNADCPAIAFSPLIPGVPARADKVAARPIELPSVERPANLEDLAFADLPTLASLVRSRKVSCVEL